MLMLLLLFNLCLSIFEYLRFCIVLHRIFFIQFYKGVHCYFFLFSGVFKPLEGKNIYRKILMNFCEDFILLESCLNCITLVTVVFSETIFIFPCICFTFHYLLLNFSIPVTKRFLGSVELKLTTKASIIQFLLANLRN